MDNMELINNQNFIYYYKSPIGLFFIRFNLSMEKWELGMKDEVLGYYQDTIAAADDVYCQATGCYEWDSLDINIVNDKAPTDIYEWERKPNNNVQ